MQIEHLMPLCGRLGADWGVTPATFRSILEVLSDGETHTVAAIAEQLGLLPNVVRRSIHRLDVAEHLDIKRGHGGSRYTASVFRLVEQQSLRPLYESPPGVDIMPLIKAYGGYTYRSDHVTAI